MTCPLFLNIMQYCGMHQKRIAEYSRMAKWESFFLLGAVYPEYE